MDSENNESFNNSSISGDSSNIEANNMVEENTTASTVYENTVVDNLQLIHEDLGVLTSFIIFFVLVLLCHYAYKFFNMFFVI